MAGPSCRFNISNPNYRKVAGEVKEALGSNYNYDIFKSVADTFSGDVKSLTKEYVLEHWPSKDAPQEKILEGSTEPPKEDVIIQYPGEWTRKEAAKPENQDKLFVFTDNTDRSSGNEPVNPNSRYAQRYAKRINEAGEETIRSLNYPKKATSAVLRGLDNAMPISTQRWYHGKFKGENGRWTNADVEEFKKVVHQEVDDIIEEWKTGKYTTIVLPNGGILKETGITDLNGKDRTKIKAALEEEMKRLYEAVGVPYVSEAAQMEKTEEQKKAEAVKEARKEGRQARIQAARWDRFAGENQGLEVSVAGDDFGKQFSPYTAVFEDGTTITLTKRDGKKKIKEVYDIGGYSIEAAYAIIKGYKNQPRGNLLKSNGQVQKVKEADFTPTRSSILYLSRYRYSSATKDAIEEYCYNEAYFKLWQVWTSQNKKLMTDLRKQAKDKILTDKYASSRISSARALAQILWGTPVNPASERLQMKYDIQRNNAVAASKQVSKAAKKMDIGKATGIKLLSRKDYSDQQIANRVNDVNDKGQSTARNNYMLSFFLDDKYMDNDMRLFINPFEGKKGAVTKFIQWIIPNDFNSLPQDLRVEGVRREKIRRLLSKGGYQKQTIVTDGSEENAEYAKVLRYIIDNFQELRQRYNPVDIQEFGMDKHRIKVTTGKNGDSGNNQLVFYTKEEWDKDGTKDADNAFRLERVSDTEGDDTDTFVLRMPDNFTERYNKPQLERLYKTIAMAIPEGSVITMYSTIVNDSMIGFYNKVVDRGFTKIADKETVNSDGATEYIGVYRRNGFIKQRVVTQDAYRLEDILDDGSPNTVYLLETDEVYMRRIEADHILSIPTRHDSRSVDESYWKDDQFEQFKRYIDDVVSKAREVIDNGYTVVIPKGFMGNGKSALNHWAPKLYQYMNDQLEALQEYGNREYMTNQYLAKSAVTVEPVEESPSKEIELDAAILQSPRARLRQVFRGIEISDLSRAFSKYFIDALDDATDDLIDDTQERINAAETQDEKDKLKRKLDKLTNSNTADVQTINEIGMEELLDRVKKKMKFQASYRTREGMDEQAQKILASLEDGYFRLIFFTYTTPLIEDAIGVRIESTQTNNVETEADKESTEEDAEGNDTPEMGWTYNYRLVDPFKALTKNVRRTISNIRMRDPNDMRKFQKDSIGEPRYWDSVYIYQSVMSRMAKEIMGNADNFVTVTPYSELSEKDRKRFPIGKPSFPILEGMRVKYPWANDLISALQASYTTNGKLKYEGMTSEDIRNNPVMVAEIGQTVSQFYTNFNTQFVSYCTMVNGRIIEENKSVGSASLKQTAITNYEGNMRFKGIDMIYNGDGSVNHENVEKATDRIAEILKPIMSPNLSASTRKYNDFWSEVNQLADRYGKDSYYEMYEAASEDLRKTCSDIVDVLKSCGMVFTDFDIFSIVVGDRNIKEMLDDLTLALNSIKGLPDNEHIFSSTFVSGLEGGKENDQFKTPNFYWNKFFEKFGDYVTEMEYEASSRILGKPRYSYVHPSYMSTTLANLTNPDIKARRRYIEENFMPYDWFYDKKNKRFRNRMLQDLYNGNSSGREQYDKGHDMLVKKDGNHVKEYSEWTPQDIYEIMFREQTQPVVKGAGGYIGPVLSDSQVCKVIQAPRYSRMESLTGMVEVVRQELGRMVLTERRNTILRMQDIEEKMGRGIPLSDAEKEYFNMDSNRRAYSEYRRRHPEKLQEVENFDKNGSKFCFFPELNDYRLSVTRSNKENNTTMFQVIQLLSANPNNPSINEVPLKTVLRSLENLTEEFYESRAKALGLTRETFGTHLDADGKEVYGEYVTMTTKEELIDDVIRMAIEDIMDSRSKEFFYTWVPTNARKGVVNEELLNAVLKNDKDLYEEYTRIYRKPSEDRPLTPEEEAALDAFYDKVYSRVKDFYYSHTYVMSQFLQIMVTDIAYYKDPTIFKGSVDFAKRFKETQGAGMKLNTNSKFGKKYQRYIILADNIRRSRSFDVLDSVLQEAVDDGRIIDIEKDAVMDKMKGINGTDAQAFRSLTSYRDIMDMLGKNSEELSQSIDNLRNGKWTMRDFYTVYTTLKPFSFGPEDQDSGIDDIHMRTMVQHKNSEAVLLAIFDTLVGSKKGDINYSKRLSGLQKVMEDKENGIVLRDNNGTGKAMTYENGEVMRAIDMAQYQSAVKVGASGVIDINYSRTKLEKYRKEGRMPVGSGFLEIEPEDSYYDIARRLGDMLDGKKIGFGKYEDAMDLLEPDENEVAEIIEKAIYKNGDKSLGYDDQVLHKIAYEHYSIQQPTDDHYTDNNAGTFASQPKHLIMADLPDDISITINGKVLKGKNAIRERYNGLLVANLIDDYVNKIEPLFKDMDKSKSAVRRFRDRLMPIIRDNPKYSNLVDALEIVTDSNGKETFALPLNNQTISNQLEEVVSSLFKNAIHKQKISGGNAILAADVGYSKSLKIRGKKDKQGKYTKIEGIECYLPAHSREMFQAYLEERTGKDGEKYCVLDPEKLRKDGLDKLIGYRIPTEGLYSIMPLIIKGFLPQQSGASIVVAQEITTLTGSDNDVDKLFLMMKALDKNLKEIKSDSGKHPLELTKKQRDNEIVDIFYAITTHPKMSHLWAHPGNFDTITLNARRMRIMKSKAMRDRFKENVGLADDGKLIDTLTGGFSQSRLNNLYRKAMDMPNDKPLKGNKTMLDVVVDFTDKYLKPLSPVYPDTFVEMHQLYMAGVIEKGIFANNTLDHAKLQWANVRILPPYVFRFEGNTIDRLDAITVTRKRGGKSYQHYISWDCAECSAAAVDNGKTPTLADLNSNKMTASFFGFLTRLGLGIEGAALLLAQPAVDSSIRNYGVVNGNLTLENSLKKMKAWLDEHNFDIEDERFDWRRHNFTTNELYQNIVGENLYTLLTRAGDRNTSERIASLYRTYDLILTLKAMYDSLSYTRDVIHYDSPNNAADTSIGGVVAQTKAVEKLNRRSELTEFEKYFSGDDQLIVYGIEKKEEEKRKKEGKARSLEEMGRNHSRRYQLYDAFMGSQLPMTQAMYTLGIEEIRTEIGPHFAFGREEMQMFTDKLCDYMDEMRIFRPEERRAIIKQAYRDFVTYRLSKTSLFGDDGNMTYDQKRQYYLYGYPAKLLKDKGLIEDLNDFDGVRRLSVKKGAIVMDRGGKIDRKLKNFITDSFDALQQSTDPDVQETAKSLFMYTYYKNGFEFGYASFGNMFSTEFQRAFPEYIKALSDMNTEPITDREIDNFFSQFIVKRNSLGLVKEIKYKTSALRSAALQAGYHDTGYTVSSYGSIDDVPEFVMDTAISGGSVRQTLLQFNKELTDMYGTVIYSPVKTNTSLHYNANQTVEEMLEVIYDQDMIDANSKTGTKKKNRDAVLYDTYHSSKIQEEKNIGRTENTPEPSDADSAVKNILRKEDDNGVMDDMSLDKAAAEIIAAESSEGSVPTMYDDFIKGNPKAADSIAKSDSDDSDVEEGDKIVKSNNGGIGTCK